MIEIRPAPGRSDEILMAYIIIRSVKADMPVAVFTRRRGLKRARPRRVIDAAGRKIEP